MVAQMLRFCYIDASDTNKEYYSTNSLQFIN